MAFKFVVICAFIAVASAGLLPVEVKTIAQPVLANAEDEYDPHPQYKFAYDVEDVISGDSKRQVESRDGDVVQGEYALNDADGFRRTVQYSADPVHGFNAVVHREPLMKALDYTPAETTVIKTSAMGYAASPVYSAPAPAIAVTHH